VSETIEVGGRTVEIGNPDKVLFPDAGITKLDLARYYARVAPVMLPHVRGRAVTMHRFPDGIDGTGFYQKHVPDYFPEWIETVTVDKENGTVEHVVCDDAATLVYLADQACITPHVWLSTTDALDRPDRMVFDLDPPEGSGAGAVRAAARAIRDLLEDLGLRSRVMTTGSKGYHVVVPLDARAGFDQVRDFAHRCADLLADRRPDDLTVEQRIAERSGRVFLDYLRNGYAQTTVAPYAVRAKSGAPVAVPLDWDELGSTDPRGYTMDNVFRRLGQRHDPWEADPITGQALDDAREALDEMES
jgi:bifunctional non-homologous end joining protein LigD